MRCDFFDCKYCKMILNQSHHCFLYFSSYFAPLIHSFDHRVQSFDNLFFIQANCNHFINQNKHIHSFPSSFLTSFLLFRYFAHSRTSSLSDTTYCSVMCEYDTHFRARFILHVAPWNGFRLFIVLIVSINCALRFANTAQNEEYLCKIHNFGLSCTHHHHYYSLFTFHTPLRTAMRQCK